jgi:RimJ/RimL family protein N-acetyltransferase
MERGEPLPEEVLDRRRDLPLRVAPVSLEGRLVRLVPLVPERDVRGLHEVSNGSAVSLAGRHCDPYDPEALVWRYLAGGPFEGAAELDAWLRPQVEASDGLCLCVRHAPSDRPIGVVNLMTNTPAHLRIELGNIWYGPIAQRTGANTEATLLMLGHAFALGYRRVEWKCDALNERSRASALRMGFRFEGVQEQHFIVKGRNRDTAWYRILDREWPEVRAHLERLVGRR